MYSPPRERTPLRHHRQTAFAEGLPGAVFAAAESGINSVAFDVPFDSVPIDVSAMTALASCTAIHFACVIASNVGSKFPLVIRDA